MQKFTRKKIYIKYILLAALVVLAVCLLYALFDKRDWVELSIFALVFFMTAGRVVEFLLGLPMHVVTRMGMFLGYRRSIGVEDAGARIVNFVIYTALSVGAFVYYCVYGT